MKLLEIYKNSKIKNKFAIMALLFIALVFVLIRLVITILGMNPYFDVVEPLLLLIIIIYLPIYFLFFLGKNKLKLSIFVIMLLLAFPKFYNGIIYLNICLEGSFYPVYTIAWLLRFLSVIAYIILAILSLKGWYKKDLFALFLSIVAVINIVLNILDSHFFSFILSNLALDISILVFGIKNNLPLIILPLERSISTKDNKEKLLYLRQELESGNINQEEYDKKRKEIIDSL